jgi:hypothetical protein
MLATPQLAATRHTQYNSTSETTVETWSCMAKLTVQQTQHVHQLAAILHHCASTGKTLPETVSFLFLSHQFMQHIMCMRLIHSAGKRGVPTGATVRAKATLCSAVRPV